MKMKKIAFFALALIATSVFEACNNGSNGDASRRGKPDTVGASQNNSGMGSGKDSTNGLNDTLQHK